jgi:hypothetical protein
MIKQILDRAFRDGIEKNLFNQNLLDVYNHSLDVTKG